MTRLCAYFVCYILLLSFFPFFQYFMFKDGHTVTVSKTHWQRGETHMLFTKHMMLSAIEERRALLFAAGEVTSPHARAMYIDDGYGAHNAIESDMHLLANNTGHTHICPVASCEIQTLDTHLNNKYKFGMKAEYTKYQQDCVGTMLDDKFDDEEMESLKTSFIAGEVPKELKLLRFTELVVPNPSRARVLRWSRKVVQVR